jgi:uncharacterized membrane protein YobD (UPF0266 family)
MFVSVDVLFLCLLNIMLTWYPLQDLHIAENKNGDRLLRVEYILFALHKSFIIQSQKWRTSHNTALSQNNCIKKYHVYYFHVFY